MTPAENIDIGQVVLQWGPWVIASGVGILLAYVNTKMENLRDRIAELAKNQASGDECDRHVQDQQSQQRTELEAWKMEIMRLQERLTASISRLTGTLDHFATEMRDVALDIKGISPRLSILETRMTNIEGKR